MRILWGLLLVLVLFLGQRAEAVTSSAKEKHKKGSFSMSEFKKPTKEELKKRLSKEQFHVTQEEGTEPAFKNAYWDNKKEGIYVDIVSGEPLFSSLEKYDSGTGWPSFFKALEPDNIVEKEDGAFFMKRTEVRSRHGDSHLGHVFPDGPAPTGRRFCMNSASLRFIPTDQLEQEGYGKYLPLFTKSPAKTQSVGEEAILAGGCFWGVEELLRKLPGVIETTVGYSGGLLDNPSYDKVKTGKTGHAESIRIVFDPLRLSYENLLLYFFRIHDPTTLNQQGNDKGTQYRSAIFYKTAEQKRVAEAVKARVQKAGKWKGDVVTQITAAGEFYPAEDYHQKYLEKEPGGYTCHYVRDFSF